MGITRFAVMAPEDRFGKPLQTGLRSQPSFGITIMNSITYSPQNLDSNST
jgi:hypothetical protein